MFFLRPLCHAIFFRFFMFRDVSTLVGPIPSAFLTSFIAGIMNMTNYNEVFTFNLVSCFLYHILDYHPWALFFTVTLQGGMHYLNVNLYHSFHTSLLKDTAASRSRRAIILNNLMSYGKDNNFLRRLTKATSKIPAEIREKYNELLGYESEWASAAYYYMNEAGI